MTLPEKVRDVTQSEWLEIRERLAAAEANAERWRQDAGAARGRYSGALSALKRAEEVAEDARQVAEQAESRLALAMAWGAEVCATLDWLTRDSGVTHSMVGAWLLGHPLSRSELAQWQDDMRVKAWTQTAEAEQRAERAEAERDEARKTIADARWAMGADQVEPVVRAILDGVGMDAGCREEYRHDVEIARADLAAARAQLAAVVAAVGEVLSRAGCSCDCDHDAESHDAECERCLGCDVEAAMRTALADPAQAAREHDERVRAEERERCAKECEARAERTRGPSEWGPSEWNPSGTVVTAAGSALFDAARAIRALGSRS